MKKPISKAGAAALQILRLVTDSKQRAASLRRLGYVETVDAGSGLRYIVRTSSISHAEEERIYEHEQPMG